MLVGYGGTESFVCSWREFKTMQLPWKTEWQFLKQLNRITVISTAEYVPRGIESRTQTDICAPVSLQHCSQQPKANTAKMLVIIFYWAVYHNTRKLSVHGGMSNLQSLANKWSFHFALWFPFIRNSEILFASVSLSVHSFVC